MEGRETSKKMKKGREIIGQKRKQWETRKKTSEYAGRRGLTMQ